MSSSAMDSLMSTVDTVTSADSDEPVCAACTSSPVADTAPAGALVAKSPPPSPKDSKLASKGVATTPASPAGSLLLAPGAAPSSLLTSCSSSSSRRVHDKQPASPTGTSSSLRTRSLDGLLRLGGAAGPRPSAPHGLDATSTTTTVSDVSSARAPRRRGTSDENAFLFLGCAQALLGGLMAVFGVLAMLHRASLSQTGAGVWGGAVSFASGAVGVVAGLRSCYSSSLRGGPGSGRPPIAPTAFMALSLVSLAVANLVLVLAAIGLVRDARTPDIQLLSEDAEGSAAPPPGSSHWERVLASCGLLVASALQLLAAIASAYRCYRLVCPCAARNPRKHAPLYNQRSSASPDSLRALAAVPGLYSSGSKERLVSRWLTRQVPGGPVYTGSPTPSGLLLFSTQPPPPGHHPQTVYTLTQPPSPGPPLVAAGVPTYPGGLSYYSHYMNVMGHRRGRLHHQQRPSRHQNPPTLPSDERLRRERLHLGHHDQERRRHQQQRPRPKAAKAVTEADVARTYTGLDRRIAEEFIMAMDQHGQQQRPRRQDEAAVD